MPTIISHSPEETAALGEQWGREAQFGWVIGLTGDLGAGKTQLVKGLARGLGITALVHSPTFALVNEYSGGRLPLFHLDLYRLETRAQIIGAGLEEYLEPEGVTVVEWIERWLGQVSGLETQPINPISVWAHEDAHPPHQRGQGWPKRHRHAHLETISEDERRITYEDFGA